MLDELFEDFGHKKKRSGHFGNGHDSKYGHHSGHDEFFPDKDHAGHDGSSHSHSGSRQHDSHSPFGHFPLAMLLKNKTFMAAVAVAVFVAVLVLIAVVILLFPVLKQGWEYVNTNGIKGIIDALWQGSKG